MNTILNIAKTELKTLFYSPIAWLILVVFTIQVNISFSDLFELTLKLTESGRARTDLTTDVFTYPFPGRTVFINIQKNLYLFLPLLTMGLMSREISSGSIKLLFSSPISSFQIIVGKYLAMLAYGILLIFILAITVIFGYFGIENLDVPYLISGLIGIYLLICAYAAIGLFMSSLTSYQVVAAFFTLALLGFFNYVGAIGQGFELIRDITYWLSMSGRSGTMISGLITSEDIVYFLIVILIFLGFSVVKLEAGRIRNKWINIGRYASVFSVCVFIGFLFSSPSIKSFVDVTRTERNTLRKNSQEIVKNLKGNLKITTYVNILGNNLIYGRPEALKRDMKRFDMYLRFKPDLEFEYVYYWDKPTNNDYIYQLYPGNSEEEIAKKIADLYSISFKNVLSPTEVKHLNLTNEENKFVRIIEDENGNKTFLRIYDGMRPFPEEKEISVALKRILKGSIKVGFLTGHGERTFNTLGDKNYSKTTVQKPYKEALINNGFDFETVDLTEGLINKELDVLVIADLKEQLSEIERNRLQEYISNGGNILIAAEPNQRDKMIPILAQFGVGFTEGVIVERNNNSTSTLVINTVLPKAPKISYVFENMVKYNQKVTMTDGMGLIYQNSTVKGFNVTPLIQTKWRGIWNEVETIDFDNETPVLNKSQGEIEKPYEMAIALSKKLSSKEQRIVVIGDADCFSNHEVFAKREGIKSNNSAFLTGVFEWLSNNEYPVDVRKPDFIDNQFKVKLIDYKNWKVFLLWVFPLTLVFMYLIIWVKRRNK